MTTSPSFQTYRVSGVPRGTSEEAMREWFPEEERAMIQHISQARSLSDFHDDDERTCVATITFSKIPPSLAKVKPTTATCPLAECLLGLDSHFSAVKIDAHFQGITPLSDASDENNGVDIVAVTGLGGRPYGSWQCVSDGSMWLQDALPRAVPMARVMVYGYATKTVNFDSHATLIDFTEDFLRTLEISRQHPHEMRRPLILIGHSLGGLIVKNAFTVCAADATELHKNLDHAIYGLVFFGTPHKGMQTDELISASRGQPSELLIRDLVPGSTKIRELSERFVEAVQHVKVVSCAELRETPTLIEASKGNFQRVGPTKFMVRQDSAYLYLPSEIETRIPIDANHSMMAKLPSTGVDAKHYKEIETQIRVLVSDALERVPKRFLKDDITTSLAKSRELVRFIQAEMAKKLYGHGNQAEDVSRNLLSHVDDIHYVLSDKMLSEVFLGIQTSWQFLHHFSKKVRELEDTIHPFHSAARLRSRAFQKYVQEPGKISETNLSSLFEPAFMFRIMDHAGLTAQSLIQMLSISMLRQPAAAEDLDKHQRLQSRTTALSRIATMQAMFRLTDTDPLPPLEGTLRDPQDSPSGIHLCNYHPYGSGRPLRVLVEYKQYAKVRDPGERRVVQSEDERQQARLTCVLAEKLATLLKRLSQVRPGPEDDAALSHEHQSHHYAFEATTYALPCLGYRNEEANGRVAILFEIPTPCCEPGDGKLMHGIRTLRGLISESKLHRVPLEQRSQLALQICTTVLNLHCSGWLHKSIRSDNVLLLPQSHERVDDTQDEDSEGSKAPSMMSAKRYDMYLIGFEFSREVVGKSNPFESSSADDLYRHPDRQGLPSRQFIKEHDLYAVGLALLEIGEGKLLHSLLQRYLKGGKTTPPGSFTPERYRKWFIHIAENFLPVSMGSRYAKAVVRCLTGDFGVEADDKHHTQLALAFQRLVVDEIGLGMCL